MRNRPKARPSTWTHWTPREDALICRLRQQGAGRAAIAASLPNRTPKAVSHRLGILLNAGRVRPVRADQQRWLPWTPQEDALLVSLRLDDRTTAEIADHFPHRTRDAIQRRAHRFVEAGFIDGHGAKPRKKWTAEQDRKVAQLRRQNRTVKEIAAALQRPVESIARRITVRIRKGEFQPRLQIWTAQEDALLVRLCKKGASAAKMSSHMSHRSLEAIQLRVRRFVEAGIVERYGAQSRKPWTREEDRKIERLRRQKKTMKEIAAAMQRTDDSIRGRILIQIRKRELPRLRKRE